MHRLSEIQLSVQFEFSRSGEPYFPALVFDFAQSVWALSEAPSQRNLRRQEAVLYGVNRWLRHVQSEEDSGNTGHYSCALET